MLLYSQHWLNLPIQTRIKIAGKLGIIKKGSTEVFENTIKSDGYLIKDVETALSMENLQKFLMTKETNHQILFDLLLVNLDKPIEQKIEEIAQVETPKPEIKPEVKPKRKYVKKK